MLRPLALVALRRLLLPLLFLAAVAASAQTQVSFTFSGTANSTGAGYTFGDPLSITFVMSTSSTPVGDAAGNYAYWIRDNSTSLWSSVSATGLTGTWNGTDSTSVATDDEIVIGYANSPNTIAFQSYAANGNLRLFAPDSTPATFVLVQGGWTGLNVSNSSIADPVAYFAARAGTYSFDPVTSGFAYIDFNVGSVNFLPSTLTISAVAVPEPATDAMLAGFGVLVFAYVRRRKAP